MNNITKDENLCIVREALEQNLKVCCKKEMIYLGDVNNTGMTQDEHFMWVCGDCGSLREEASLGYDDEDLYNLLSSYQEEMKDTNIMKELKKGDFE